MDNHILVETKMIKLKKEFNKGVSYITVRQNSIVFLH